MPARLVIEACLLAGARPAGPGEFTRRAFLKGKLSLDQAEAVADLIHAEDEMAAGAALRQIQGGFDRELETIEGPLRDLLVDLEGSLEFSEEEGFSVPPSRVRKAVQEATERIHQLLDLSAAGRHLREGVQVVLVGPPNVGKSSLLNALLGKERVLVDHEPGTTRDVVAARARRKGFLFVLHDTAGLRGGGGRVEKMGMDRTLRALALADIILNLREAGDVHRKPGVSPQASEKPLSEAPLGWDQDDLGGERGETLSPQGWPEFRDPAEVIEVWTKADLAGGPPKGGEVFSGEPAGALRKDPAPAVVTSALQGWGLEELWGRLVQATRRERLQEAARLGVVLNSRHQFKLMKCRESLSTLQQDLISGSLGEEVVATLLASILAELGEISGRVFSEDLLESVFSRFCVGK
jgi:tRNA modification GTPase